MLHLCMQTSMCPCMCVCMHTSITLKMSQMYTSKSMHILAVHLTSQVVISIKAVACASQAVAFNGHLHSHKYLTGLRNKPQQKLTRQFLAEVHWQLVYLWRY